MDAADAIRNARNMLESAEANLRRARQLNPPVAPELSFHRARESASDAMRHCAHLMEELSRELGTVRGHRGSEIERLERRLAELRAQQEVG